MIAKTGAALTRYLKRYNISKETYLSMLEAQGGKFDICKKESDLVIDHDHSCCNVSARSCGKCVRGLLCEPCNLMLGHADDSIYALNSGAVYLFETGLKYKA